MFDPRSSVRDFRRRDADASVTSKVPNSEVRATRLGIPWWTGPESSILASVHRNKNSRGGGTQELSRHFPDGKQQKTKNTI